ncbi:hypothetical protein Poly51_48440 [Rubripirellula tenax]|uniref:Uncharacterized protein n=1 Tax=Rubripirellula tenax TaxID=2528015 RepID=A0A5C6EKC7_9BACT|nr:hypothetical protein Poly51_48440 [Rubripirellula tenax]
MFAALAVDPQCHHRRLILTQTNAIEHQSAPCDCAEIFVSQLFNELTASFLPKTRNVGLFDTWRIWLQLFDASGADARNDRLNDLCLKLLGISGNTVTAQLDFVARAVAGLLTHTRPDDFFSLALVQNAART